MKKLLLSAFILMQFFCFSQNDPCAFIERIEDEFTGDVTLKHRPMKIGSIEGSDVFAIISKPNDKTRLMLFMDKDLGCVMPGHSYIMILFKDKTVTEWKYDGFENCASPIFYIDLSADDYKLFLNKTPMKMRICMQIKKDFEITYPEFFSTVLKCMKD